MPKPKPFSIRQYFAGKGVLLTGSTGFLAKAVVEKMLRDLPEVRQIYLLIRPRVKADGSRVDPRERLREEILRNSAFRRLREQLGDEFEKFCESKITCIAGDLTRERLGMDEASFSELAKNVQVVINSAATVVFDERLDLALDLNTMGPQRLLEFARKAGGIYVHISTAYVSGKRTGLAPERLVDPLEQIDAQLPAGVERPKKFDVREEVARLGELAKHVLADCEKQLKAKNITAESEAGIALVRTALVGAGMRRAQSLGWNDTYTYTKYLGEQLIKLNHGSVPTVVVRPSIIESSLSEPEPGWLDGLRMADPIIIGFGKGRLADFPANQNVVLDIIPADLVVNGILTGAAHIAAQGGFDLFTVASSSENPLVFRALYDHVRDYFLKHPMTDRAGKPVAVPRWKFPTVEQYRWRMRNRYLRPIRAANAILNMPMPLLPGTRKMRARLRNLNTTLEQLLYYVDIYGPYVNLQCRFETVHARELLEALNPDERERFDFDPRRIRWRNYLQDVHIPGLKRNILRMEAPPRAGAGEGHLLDEEGEAASKRGAAAIRGVPQTLVELCARGAERFGNKSIAEIRRPEGVVRVNYAEMFTRSAALARTLMARLDLRPGDRVALMAENGPEWILGYMAIAQACCAAVPLDRQLPPREAARLIKLVEAKAVIASPSLVASAPDVFVSGSGLPVCLNLLNDFQPFPEHDWPYPQASIGERPLREPAPEMLASLLFTSGTTYDPKGVMLNHANLIADALSVAEILEPMESDRFLSVLPLHHALEFTGGFTIPMYGGSTVHYIESHKEIPVTLKLAEITVIIGVPRLFQSFMERIRERLAAASAGKRLAATIGKTMAATAEMAGSTTARRRIFNEIHENFGGKLRLLVSGGAALDPEIFHFFKNFGITIVEGYGLTETAPVLTVNPISAARAGTVGPAVPGVEVRIDAPNAEGIGEVLGRGPNVMRGYWRNPAATERAFVNGWFATGDLGRIDRDGYLHITGRLKDVIVTAAGKNVYPDEVEAALHGIPGVKGLCIVGMPARAGSGEEVMAVVVPEENASRDAIKAAIDARCRELASHQRVSRIEFQDDELPKTSTLKVQRNKLKQRYLANAQSSSDANLPPQPPSLRGKGENDNGEARLAASFGDMGAADRNSPAGIFAGVARAVAEIAPRVAPSDITPDMKLQMDLGIDSIGRVDLLQKLEMHFEISIPSESEGRLFTVRDVVTIVEAAQKNAGAPGENASAKALRLRELSNGRMAGIQDGMRHTFSKSILQGMFSTSASVFMNTWLAIDCHGLENIPKDGAYILAANHCSHLDSVAIREVLGRRASDLYVMGAKDYFFNTKLKSWFFETFLNALPFDREENVAESIQTCKTVLQNGRAILIFPEGTRSITGELQAFKPGIGVLGIELDVSVLPVHLSGTFESLPKGRSLPRPTRIDVRIGAPLSFETLKAERGKTPATELYRSAAGQLRARIEALANLPTA